MPTPDFSAAVCPCDSSPQLGPSTPFPQWLSSSSPPAHNWHTSGSQWSGQLCILILAIFLGRTSPAQGFAVWQKLAHPQPLPLPISVGSPWWHCFFLWWWVIQKSSAASVPLRGLFAHSSLCTRVCLGVPLAENPPGQRRQLACWSCAMSPYGPGMESDMTKYEGYSCLTVPNSAKGTLRPGCWYCALSCSQLPLTNQNTTSQPAKTKMPHWGAVEMS